ncbi:CDP-diacylglycerol--serine O-phosphatidyltransferase [Meira miltonrushii]|uniref:CDP-diacylglycerol--serine O-phosphatidyltransferase n=1 Tax=Meira miltonrushii TaxID=1280837 RepID=A0A316VEL3_9BASI|nr:CDP-diacylglycerol--serine O-phosphatidyltransferase [Meira miltonrushii]PWN36097.1 CDP-diacylglycerol--serine O-phosphatidyltransferase [Meira miltonrushii]
MPGTVPKATDPILVTSIANAPAPLSAQSPIASSASQPQPQESNSKAALSSDLSKHSLLVTSVPAGHPTAGVASPGAAQLTASGAQTSSLAPSNSPAKAMAQPKTNPANVSGASKKSKGKSSSGGGKTANDGQEGNHAELIKFIETNGHFSLVRNFHLADAFTLMNGFCGAQSLFASGRYLTSSDPRHAWSALWFPLFGAIFDLLDGKVARWRNSSSMLGQELDSLADSLSFGAAPAFAAFALGLRLPLDTLLLTLFVCAGIARLARFNVTTASVPHDAKGKAQYFEGLPIPSSLVLVGGMAICLLAGRVEPGGLPIVLAKERGALAGKGLTFTASLREVIPGANLGRGVPLGTLGVDGTQYVTNYLNGFSFLRQHKDVVDTIASFANLEVHTLSLLFGVWAILMISKTLRVPKP